MLLYHFPLTSSSATATIVNKGLKDDYTISGDNNFSSGGKLSAYAKDMGENKFYLSISNFSLDYTLCFRAKATSNTLLVSVGYTPFEITADNTWHDYVICDKKVYKDGLFLTNYNYSAGIVAFGDSEDSCQGMIQDIRIYDYALSQAEIKEYSRALVVHYPLQGNELNPSVLKDVSGLGNDYTLQGTNSYQLDSARGVKSLHTTDTAIYTQTPISSGYTTSFWCKYNGEWNHLCNNGSKYVDGVVNSSLFDTIYATLTASGYDIVDYRVYATALSAEDIKNLYNSPISVSKHHQTIAFEFKENPLYPSKYWRTPTYAEMNYIFNTRTNAANLRTLGRVEISSGVYRNGCFILPDDWVLPVGVTMTITSANYTTNSYSLGDLGKLESNGTVFIPEAGNRTGSGMTPSATELDCCFLLGNQSAYGTGYCYFAKFFPNKILGDARFYQKHRGASVRLCRNSSKGFSTSATTKIDFAPANLQYHCTQHIWRFAEHSYDIIGAANANISDSYNGWIDLFGYGTSGVNYSPTLHTTNNADYASGDIANTDNDWGINEIQSYDYNVKNFALNKNGIVQHNELRENDSEYKFVQYLQSDGSQVINLGFKNKVGYSYEFKFKIVSYPQQWNTLFGARTSASNSDAFDFGWGYPSGDPKFYANIGSKNPKFSINSLNTLYTVKVFETETYINGTKYTYSPNLTDGNYEMYLFGLNGAGSSTERVAIQLIEFSQLNSIGEVERKYLPAIKNGTAGLLEIYSGEFLIKSRGNNFSVGEEMPLGCYNDKLITNELIEN